MSVAGDEPEKVEDVDFSEELEEEEAPVADTQPEEPVENAEVADAAEPEETTAAAESADADEAGDATAPAAAANGEPMADVADAVEAADVSPNPDDASKKAAVKLAGGGADPLEEPPHGSEVFVGGIPKAGNVTDEQLLEFASAGGEVYSCAVLRDPGSGLNRGYGFIKFKSKEIAQKAMTKLNDTEMKDHPGMKIRVLPSQSKNRLYLGNLPKEMSQADLEETLKAATKGLEKVELLMSKDWPGQNRGFCFLEFYNHACAQAAKGALSPPNFQLGNKPLTITFAEPRRADSVSDDQTQQIKSIFVGNLPDTANEAKLRELFAPLGEITRAFIPAPRDGKSRREFGFVHFQDRASVLQAIENNDKGDKVLMDGTPLEVKMGRVYHENPPAARTQQGFQQASFGGRGGRGAAGAGMSAGRLGGRMGMGGGYQQQAGRMGGISGGYGGGYGGYGQYSGAMGGMGGGMEGAYGGYGGGEAYYDDGSYGSYGGMAMGGGSVGGGAGAGMSMVPMMLPNGQVGYVLSNAGGGAVAGGMAAGGMAAGGMGGSGMGGPVRGRGYGGVATGGQAAGGYGPAGRGRSGGAAGYGGRGGGYGGQQRYAPY